MQEVSRNKLALVELDDECGKLGYLVKTLYDIQYMAVEHTSSFDPNSWYVPLDYLSDLQKSIRLHIDQLFLEKKLKGMENGTN